MNYPVYGKRDKYGRLVPTPSAMINFVHFLLGAMLPCSTAFCTSAKISIDNPASCWICLFDDWHCSAWCLWVMLAYFRSLGGLCVLTTMWYDTCSGLEHVTLSCLTCVSLLLCLIFILSINTWEHEIIHPQLYGITNVIEIITIY